MPLNETDKAWVRQAITDAHRVLGWGKLSRFLKDWSGLGATVAVFLFVAVQWTTYIEFRTTTKDRLDYIDRQLLGLRATKEPAKVLQELSALDKKSFDQSIPILRTVVEQRLPPKSLYPPSLQAVAVKLAATNESTPEYWPTVLRFLQFASSDLSPDVPPPGSSIDVVVTAKNVVLNLSDVVLKMDGGSLRNSTISKSRIIFTDKPVGFENVKFINCAFEMPDATTPLPSLQQTGRVLLASSDLKSVSIPSVH